MLCLADEAHGTHFYFSDELPVSAMEAGADMAAVSMHKSGGSLTQSSLLLCGPAMQEGPRAADHQPNPDHLGVLPFALQPGHLPAELGPAGKEAFAQVVRLADYARGEINRIGGYYAFSKELINGDSVFDFDGPSSR